MRVLVLIRPWRFNVPLIPCGARTGKSAERSAILPLNNSVQFTFMFMFIYVLMMVPFRHRKHIPKRLIVFCFHFYELINCMNNCVDSDLFAYSEAH